MAAFSQTNRTKGQDLEKQVLPILGSKLVQLWEQSLFNQIGGATKQGTTNTGVSAFNISRKRFRPGHVFQHESSNPGL